MLLPDARILVINVSRIGDTLLTTPALRALKSACPQGHLSCFAHPQRAALLEHLPFIDEIGHITAKRAWLHGWARTKKWDYAIVYGHDAPLLRYALRVAHSVIAFRQKDDALNRKLAVAIEESIGHAVRERVRLVEALGVAVSDFAVTYRTTEPEQHFAHGWLAGRGAANAKPLIGFQVASFPTKSYRDWPLESFVALGERLLATYPTAHILILGGSESRAKARELAARLGRATAAAGGLSLRETAAVIAQLDLYIGVDTGPTHIAGALRVPMVALYHCRHRGRYLGPIGHPRFSLIEHPASDADCSPSRPMSEITIDQVWREARALLDGR